MNRLSFEQCEPRYCLSITFAVRDLECCVVSQAATSTQIADFNADGKMDVLAGTEHQLVLYLNGDQDFESRWLANSDRKQYEAVDMDGDSDLDILAFSAYGQLGGISWFENLDGQANFSSEKFLRDLDQGRIFYALDIEQDGDVDLVSSNNESITLHENRGAGLLEIEFDHVVSNTCKSASQVKANDIDDDGLTDIIATCWGDAGAQLGYFRRQPDNSFSAMTIVFESAVDFLMKDFDGDGDSDLLALSFDSQRLFENNGTGTFQQASDFSESFGNTFSAADWDRDGDIDLFRQKLGKVLIYENVGTGQFADAELLADEVGSMFIEDMNADDLPDLLLLRDSGFVWAKGNGTIDSLVDFAALGPVAYTTWSMASTDVDGNGNGYSDFFVGGEQDHLRWLRVGEDSETSVENVFIGEGARVTEIRFLDLDRDGHDDLLYLRNDTRSIDWLKYEPNLGAFHPAATLATDVRLSFAFDMLTTDIDLDGDIDLIAYGALGDVFWFENTSGVGGFTAAQSIVDGAGRGLDSIVSTDIDNDGDIDFLIASSLRNFVKVLENRGNSFAVVDLANVNGVHSLQAIDFDDDGILDLVFAFLSLDQSGAIGWMKGTVPGEFAPQVTFADEMLPLQSMKLADFDDDGDIDIAALTSSELYLFTADEFQLAKFVVTDRLVHDDRI